MYVCLNRGTTGGNLSLPDFVNLAADAGFAGADLDMVWAEEHGASALQDLYAGRNLKFGGWGSPVDHRTEASKVGDGLRRLEKWAKIAAELKIDTCATWTLPSSPFTFMQNWQMHVNGLKPVTEILREHGLRFGLEFVAPWHLRVMHPHEFIFTPGLMLELADAIGPNVGLLVDCWHCYNSGTPWQQLAKIPANKIVLCHLNDVPNLPLDQILDSQRLLPGDGILDLPGFFAALKQAGYDGPVALEAFHCVAHLPPLDAAKKAWKAVSRIDGAV